MKAEFDRVTWRITVFFQGEKLRAPDFVDEKTGRRHPAYWLPCSCCGELERVDGGTCGFVCSDCEKPCQHHPYCALKRYEHFDDNGNRMPCEPLRILEYFSEDSRVIARYEDETREVIMFCDDPFSAKGKAAALQRDLTEDYIAHDQKS